MQITLDHTLVADGPFFPIRDSLGRIIPVVAITGLNKSGKTTLMEKWADQFGYAYFDHENRPLMYCEEIFFAMDNESSGRVILYDEVDRGLDSAEQRRLINDVYSFAKKHSVQIVIVSHLPEVYNPVAQQNGRFFIEHMWEAWNKHEDTHRSSAESTPV